MVGDPLAEFGRFGTQLIIRERLYGRLKGVDSRDGREHALDRPLVAGPKNLCECLIKQTGVLLGSRAEIAHSVSLRDCGVRGADPEEARGELNPGSAVR